MRKSYTDDKLTADKIAGYATELTVWRFISCMAKTAKTSHEKGVSCRLHCLEEVVIEGKDFILNDSTNKSQSMEDLVWHIGACVYRLLMGSEPFGGKGKDGQTAQSPLPHLSAIDYSPELSETMAHCLDYIPAKRPLMADLLRTSENMIAKCQVVADNLKNLVITNPANKKRRLSTYSFWPETMTILIVAVLSLLPVEARAQGYMQAHNNKEIMELVKITTMLRDKKSRDEVYQKLEKDSLWTKMDELEKHSNECSIEDDIDMFGINHVASDVELHRRGIVSPGNRFKNSADGIHKYSFIELTVKSGKEISYQVEGHKGEQLIAVVPYNKRQNYNVTFCVEGKGAISPYKRNTDGKNDGISYASVDLGTATRYSFSIKNNGAENASFVVITYNSGM